MSKKKFRVPFRIYVPVTLAGDMTIEIEASNLAEAEEKALTYSKTPKSLSGAKILSVEWSDDIHDMASYFSETAKEKGGIAEAQFDESDIEEQD